jgi:xanthosine utilization system XapX-like protein
MTWAGALLEYIILRSPTPPCVGILPMQTIQLGQSTLQVTPICLDPTTFGEQVVQATAHSILDRALERGIKFIAGGRVH